MGNAFIHFPIRILVAAAPLKTQDTKAIRVMLEHPKDLGRTRGGGDPASIWQFEELEMF